jgi:monovalent cation:H+ antiporter-2, CPA2 family
METLAIGLVAAFAGGALAAWLRLPAIVGYLLAGVLVGPYTPGLVADPELASELAEIGVVLLLFGVGMHFSIADLVAVRGIAVPGGLGQAAVATAAGLGVGLAWGWSTGEALVFGLAISVASTVVLLRSLKARDLLASLPGRTAVGWLLVEDVLTVVVLVVLPVVAVPLGGTSEVSGGLAAALLPALLKLVGLVAVLLLVGPLVVPPLLSWIDRSGSRELFLLAILALAVGIAYAATAALGVSAALAAFLAGVVVNRSAHSERAVEQVQPLEDAFAALFFVSVGMLIDPTFLWDDIVHVLVVAGLIVVIKSLTAYAIVLALRGPRLTATTAAVGLAQIGEFSFILAQLGRSLDLIGAEAHNLILAGALLSITVNPFLYKLLFCDAPACRGLRGAGQS